MPDMSGNIDSLMDLATAYWKSAALSAAVELRIFEALDGSAASAPDVAARLGTSPGHTEGLLDALSGMRLLAKQGGRYRIAAGMADYLSPSGPCCILDALRFNSDLYALWGRLAQSAREGKPVLPPGSHLGVDPARTRRFVLGMHSRALAIGPAVLPSLHLKGCRRLLDVGAGSGTFARLLVERNPGLRATLFDLPPVLQIARELIQSTAEASRIAFHPGDYRRDPFPGGHDAVLFCGALHQETPESARQIISKIARVLEPGGRLFVVDMMLEADRTQPEFSAFFSLNVMLTSPGGRVFSGEAACCLLCDAGFEQPDLLRPAGSPYWVLAARKPDSVVSRKRNDAAEER